MVQQKQEALAKKARRDIATLVEKGKLETARVRVENIVRPWSAFLADSTSE
jgi:vacuolar protein sorting-associated protein IST1